VRYVHHDIGVKDTGESVVCAGDVVTTALFFLNVFASCLALAPVSNLVRTLPLALQLLGAPAETTTKK
jgi:hypothetical protein